jgi:hypothetical protein
MDDEKSMSLERRCDTERKLDATVLHERKGE